MTFARKIFSPIFMEYGINVPLFLSPMPMNFVPPSLQAFIFSQTTVLRLRFAPLLAPNPGDATDWGYIGRYIYPPKIRPSKLIMK